MVRTFLCGRWTINLLLGIAGYTPINRNIGVTEMNRTKLIPPRPAGFVPVKLIPEPFETKQTAGQKLLTAIRIKNGLGRYAGIAKRS